MNTTTSPAPGFCRWRFRFSLRTMFVAMLALGCGFAWLGLKVKRALDQRRAVAALQAESAIVSFAHPRSACARSEWLRSKLGADMLLDVTFVEILKNEFSNDDMVHLRGLTQLKGLFVEHTQVDDAGLEHLQGLTQLEYISLRGAQQVRGAGFVHLRGLTQLKTLVLGETNVTDAGLAHLRGLTQLEFLSLNNTQVTDRGLVHLRGLRKLEVLMLDDTQITDEGLVHLSEMKQLNYVSLSNTQVSDAGFEELRKMLPNYPIESTYLSTTVPITNER